MIRYTVGSSSCSLIRNLQVKTYTRLPAREHVSQWSDKAQHVSPPRGSRVFYNCGGTKQPRDARLYTAAAGVFVSGGYESQGDVSEPLQRRNEEVGQLMLSHNGPPYTMELSDISVPAAPLKPEMWQTQSHTHMETLLRRCQFSVYQAQQWAWRRAE